MTCPQVGAAPFVYFYMNSIPKSAKLIKLVALTMLIPVVLYWGAQLKEFSPNTAWSRELAVEYGKPYWLIYLEWSLFPWGVIITGICVALYLGVVKFKKIARIFTVIISALYAVFWSYTVESLGQGVWNSYDVFFVGYAAFLVIFFNIPSIKKCFQT